MGQTPHKRPLFDFCRNPKPGRTSASNKRYASPREECAALGGIGPCGCAFCCAKCVVDAKRVNVSVRMAKKQNISLNPTNLYGHCGKIKCCTAFEYTESPQKESTENENKNIQRPES